MASFDLVNYGLRPSKSIQRQLAFDGFRRLQANLGLKDFAYIGFGSIWFTDFIMAHRLLGINDMVSIEAHDVGYERAKFNCPYAPIRVMHGLSSNILPTLFTDELLKNRPWIIWLDYDYEFNEDVKEDVRLVLENAPLNSIFLITYNGTEMAYGRALERPDRVRDLFGSVFRDRLAKNDFKDERLHRLLMELTQDLMCSIAAESSRPGRFVPSFRMIYRDGAPMITVGGIFADTDRVQAASTCVRAATWPCFPAKPIVAPQLTLREATMLQSQLPNPEGLTRNDVRALGFDLEDDQIEAFSSYYLQYPSFAQIMF
ncbi:O-methyltransferase [Methylobacterium nodulans]|uniref:Uncharacterized protein n=1 Tax=Methylobacterium nodulans (strain LMG 21967 / CNCM I-2342 / ORS 2060) TaxID=460265 RepID=B8IIZ4_METNO|nr:O-methyltransferase [Methylobacterium nodulans]ACL61789.1 conserved hypothetical protein [Methylobacterium nodulans ORS 2060]